MCLSVVRLRSLARSSLTHYSSLRRERTQINQIGHFSCFFVCLSRRRRPKPNKTIYRKKLKKSIEISPASSISHVFQPTKEALLSYKYNIFAIAGVTGGKRRQFKQKIKQIHSHGAFFRFFSVFQPTTEPKRRRSVGEARRPCSVINTTYSLLPE